ncbi:hypothetical protein H2201_002921 [Coniosporium apollinis]|uniref:Uncharacterized protein n=1 Tax=Coniosporium apollinis TaxID=61459 RepID=A0ABQ9P1A9_9PEZI|nr:hypothetical protein H2201_002921 [Coniosporium apollinis]
MSLLPSFLSSNLPSESTIAQQKAYVTYTFSHLNASVTLLEYRSVISSSGTTGLRTWEAALHLGSFLASNPESVAGKNVLELGAGTGLLSILCAEGLGVKRAMATDGDEGVVDALKSNIFLNGLEGSRKIESSVLRWGRTIRTTAFEEDFDDDPYDIVLGADITYDKTVVPWLASTLRELFDLRPSLEAFISATIRNEDTFNAFVYACGRNHLDVKDIEFEPVPVHSQTGPFYPVDTPIRIVHITSKGSHDPFAI